MGERPAHLCARAIAVSRVPAGAESGASGAAVGKSVANIAATAGTTTNLTTFVESYSALGLTDMGLLVGGLEQARGSAR